MLVCRLTVEYYFTIARLCIVCMFCTVAISNAICRTTFDSSFDKKVDVDVEGFRESREKFPHLRTILPPHVFAM